MLYMRTSKYILLFIVASTILSACGEESGIDNSRTTSKSIEITDDALLTAFGKDGGELIIPFKTEGSWSAAINTIEGDSFCTVYPEKGEAGRNSVIVTVQKSYDANPRQAVLTLSCGKDSETVTISQTGGDYMSLSEPKKVLSDKEESFVVNVFSTFDWDISDKGYGSGWVTMTPTKGAAGTTSVTFNVDENDRVSQRTQVITFSESPLVELTVVQAGRSPKLIAVETDVKLSYDASHYRIRIISDYSWSVSPSAEHDWISTSKTSNSEDMFVEFYCLKNYTGSGRVAEFIVANDEAHGCEPVTIHITQEGLVQPMDFYSDIVPEGGNIHIYGYTPATDNNPAATQETNAVSNGKNTAVTCENALYFTGAPVYVYAYYPSRREDLTVNANPADGVFTIDFSIPESADEDCPVLVSRRADRDENPYNTSTELHFIKATPRLVVCTDATGVEGAAANATVTVNYVHYGLPFNHGRINVTHENNLYHSDYGVAPAIEGAVSGTPITVNASKVQKEVEGVSLNAGESETEFIYSRYLPPVSAVSGMTIELSYTIRLGDYSWEENLISINLGDYISTLQTGHEYWFKANINVNSVSWSLSVMNDSAGGGGGGTK